MSRSVEVRRIGKKKKKNLYTLGKEVFYTFGKEIFNTLIRKSRGTLEVECTNSIVIYKNSGQPIILWCFYYVHSHLVNGSIMS